MSTSKADGKTRSQLDEDIKDALASTSDPTGQVGYWPAFPEESTPAARSPARHRRRAAAPRAARKKATVRARPTKKRTVRKASSRRPRAKSARKPTRRKTTKRKARTRSSTRKARKATKAKGKDHSRASGSTRVIWGRNAKKVKASPPGSTPADPLTVVTAAVRVMPAEARFGPWKVFIYPLWRRVKDRIGMTLEEFKRWLVVQNRERGLDLSRADLFSAMDPKLVKRSEINDLGSSFHFVVDREAANRKWW